MPIDQAQHEFFMQLALKIGEKGRISAPPNPWVGCVIVKDGEILGEGYHEAPGKPHAEVVAIEAAKGRARGATAYVTLEPCAHFGRTPPCVKTILESGLSRVVIPFLDPDPLVSGKGKGALEEKGIEVLVGICAEEAKKSLAPYLHHRKTGMPYVVLKCALSLDGKIAAADGASFWITGEEARQDVHWQRASSQAILIGAKTALLDKPRLTVRGIEGASIPLRVIVDAKGILPAEGPLFEKALGKTLIFTTSECPKKSRIAWEEKGCQVIDLPSSQEGVDLKDLCKILGEWGVIQLLVEGGGTLFQSFFEQKLFQRLSLYYGACLIGANGHSFYLKESAILSDAQRLTLDSLSRFGNDLRLDYLSGS